MRYMKINNICSYFSLYAGSKRDQDCNKEPDQDIGPISDELELIFKEQIKF